MSAGPRPVCLPVCREAGSPGATRSCSQRSPNPPGQRPPCVTAAWKVGGEDDLSVLPAHQELKHFRCDQEWQTH